MRNADLGRRLLVLPAVLILPLFGAWLAGRPLQPLWQFPPRLNVPMRYPHWSWAWCLVLIGVTLGFAWKWGGDRPPASAQVSFRVRSTAHFPAWGWVAVAWIGLWWCLAWTRFAWFEPAQRFTFSPLWLGFIVAVNAATDQRAGTCLLRRSPLGWARLFLVSACFWWMFEWLNRFVENWHYLGVADFGPFAYAANASLCFSTVLPAVCSVQEWLLSLHSFRAQSMRGPRWAWPVGRHAGICLIFASMAGLVFAGFRPHEGYPALWLAPAGLLTGIDLVSGQPPFWRDWASGNWSWALSWATAALVCGLCWELWNFHSAAKWIYTVPHVDRWHLFEMPILGYLGYLGFGLECGLAADAVLGRSHPKGLDGRAGI